MEIIARHYEHRTMVHEVYEVVRRYTITTFTDEAKKPQELRDGPFDFSWGGGAQIRKKISSMSRMEEKKIEHH